MKSTPLILGLVLAGCGSGGLSDGAYTAIAVNQVLGCMECPSLEDVSATWTVTGGGTTLNTGKEAVTLVAESSTVGWTEDYTQVDGACYDAMHLVTTLTIGPSPVQGTIVLTMARCAGGKCECNYKVTMTKQ